MPFTSNTSTTTDESKPRTACPLMCERRVSIATGSNPVGMDTAPSSSRQEPVRGVTTKGIDWPGDGSGYAVMDKGQANSYYHGTGQMGDAMGDDE